MKILAIDFETHLISAEQPSPKPVCLSWHDGISSGLIVGFQEMENFLESMLGDPDLKVIAHNFKFEALVIAKWYPKLFKALEAKINAGNFYCTMLCQQLLNNVAQRPLKQLGLAALVQHYFKVDISAGKAADAWRTRYAELEDVPVESWPTEAVDYAISDSIWAYKLYLAQDLKMPYTDAHSSQFYLGLMGQFGMIIDGNRVAELEAEIDAHLKPHYELLTAANLCYIDEKTGKIKKRMNDFRAYIIANIPPENLLYTNTDTVSTAGTSLESYALVGDKLGVISAFLQIAEYEKIKTAFLTNLKAAAESPDPLIRSEYNAVVSSGRTSSHKSKFYPSVNIQQMPRGIRDVTWDVRNCFIPRPGFKLVSIDYNGLELASVASQLKYLYRKSNMADKINSGSEPVDMHSIFAHTLQTLHFKKEGKEPYSYEHFVANKKKPGFKEFRNLAKPINLGFPGGIGYDTMRGLLQKSGITTDYEVLIKSNSENQIATLVRRYKFQYPNIRTARLNRNTYAIVYDELVELKTALFNLYPDLKQFLTKTHEKFLTGDKVRMKNDFGEWELEPMYAFNIKGIQRDFCTYTAFCNGFLMQSPAAIGAKAAMNAVISKYYNHPDLNPLAFIHDEIIFEVRDNENLKDLVEDVAGILIVEMQKVLKGVRIAVEASVMDYWSKDVSLWDKTYWRDAQ